MIVGTAFKGWEGYKFGHDINVPTLLINGEYDEVQSKCFEPWFWAIPKTRWVTLGNTSHMSHWEERDRFIQLSGSFLKAEQIA